jgi:hypothetical protein
MRGSLCSTRIGRTPCRGRVCGIGCSSHDMTVEHVTESLSNPAVPLWVAIQNLINWLQVFA